MIGTSGHHFHSPSPLAEHCKQIKKNKKVIKEMIHCILTEKEQGKNDEKIDPARQNNNNNSCL